MSESIHCWLQGSDKTWRLFALLALCVALGACSKTPPPPATAPVALKTAPPPQSVTPPPPAPAPPPQPSPDSTPAAPAPDKPNISAPAVAGINEITSGSDMDPNAGGHLKGGELATPEVLAAYNKRLAMVNYQISDYPQNIQQLPKWPMMPPLPKAPPGKTLVYDVRTRTLRLTP